MTRAALGAALAAVLFFVGSAPLSGAEPTRLRVMVFPVLSNLTIFAAQAQGFFARRNLAVDVAFTPSSDAMRDGLAKGAFEIAHGGVDNAVALVETTGADVVIVMGGENGLNELIVQPRIRSIDDLRGTRLAVDAPNTAYALHLKKILLLHGLVAGRDYEIVPIGGTPQRLAAMRARPDLAGSLLNPPTSVLAAREGFKSLGAAVAMFGPYQATGAWVRRAWARENAAVLERYLAAYVEGVRWVLAGGHREEAVALLADRLEIPREVATASYERAIDPASGLARDARLDLDGFRSVLALRAEIEGQWGGRAPAPDKYLDLGYYERALKSLAP